eukprot:CAMPEP_0184861960 /NCGR_PEP_ID=MMETSP0580-20130426/6522_1 /TAXON_ID=1118495 /ORGANISM="Dactyliosolen fragilissimus" /LENGTH=1537 /DNA_ID=CAMNT_0027359643 /DNA_START=407 /DNA_END=5020 /DNA_ORIENTATION=+
MEENLLRAIAISSASSPDFLNVISSQNRQEAFTTLEQFKKLDDSIRMPIVLNFIQSNNHTFMSSNFSTAIDITAPTKLYALGVLQSFFRKGYDKLSDVDRLSLRNSVVNAARQLLAFNTADNTQNASSSSLSTDQTRILAMKIATLLADATLRDFPQRWTNLMEELFLPPQSGGLWYDPSVNASIDDIYIGGAGHYGPMIGIKMCLETLRLVTEDCTDSDFNSKISTKRRNDVLIGLNEVKSRFLPLIFNLLSSQYSVVCGAVNTLGEMNTYLASQNRSESQMSLEERNAFDAQIRKRDGAGRIVADCLLTIEKFCQSMPLDWMLVQSNGSNRSKDSLSIPQSNNGCDNRNDLDFLSALLHLLREDTADIQVLAVSCLGHLSKRKLDFDHWMTLISTLPQAVMGANEESSKRAAQCSQMNDSSKLLVRQLPFHRGLSSMFANIISAHLAHISTNDSMVKNRGPQFHTLSNYLNLMTEMLSHPSPRICQEQINTWIALLREPQIAKCKTKILRPYMERVVIAYMHHVVRFRWDDVDERIHQQWELMEASYDDTEEYESSVNELRSKSSLLFRFVSNIEPGLVATTIHTKLKYLLSAHGFGDPRDTKYIDKIGQIRQQSDAVLQFEGFYGPMENLLHGIPEWAINESKTNDPSFMEPYRVEIRRTVRSNMGEIINMVISWNPNDTWLKFRRANLLDTFKWYWRYEPLNLLSGVEILLNYLTETDPQPNTSIATPSLKDSVKSNDRLSDDIISLRKKSGVALISISKRVPHLLVPWLAQLSEKAKALFDTQTLLHFNEMQLFEFLSCVATAVDDPIARSNFLSDVLSSSINTLESPYVKEGIYSFENFMSFLGISQASTDPSSTTNPDFVKQTKKNFEQMFSALNQLLSIGKRCNEAAKKRPNGGIPLQENVILKQLEGFIPDLSLNAEFPTNFPDEGAVSLSDLAINDPFVPLWPRILPPLLQCLDFTLQMWHPEVQAQLLANPIQRYVLAISDDEVYLAQKQDSSNSGVFGEGGTAGSVVSGWDRRDANLAPKWSGWFNELRNTCFQLLGLMTSQRVLFAPEMAGIYEQFVAVVANPAHLRSMEHRHLTQYLKQFIEIMLVSCPASLYSSHLSHILRPLFEHIQSRLQSTWNPIIGGGFSTPSLSTSESTKALFTSGCDAAAKVAVCGGQEWFDSYYRRGGLFVGDADSSIGDSCVEKARVELSRSFSDVIQTALALKGEWALVLANQAKEDQAQKKNDPSKLETGPKSQIFSEGKSVNADGTPRNKFHIAIEARKNLRIHKLCHFLLLEDETIAGYLTLSIIQCVEYPDAYLCRRCTKLCHRILETVAWVQRYTQLLGQRLFTIVVKALVTEPKWMVGLEWEMISLLRDLYCRLVLGQSLLCGAQGPGMIHTKNTSSGTFEQAKTVNKPLQGGGILCNPSNYPRQILAKLPGVSVEAVIQMESILNEKLAAKNQKDELRDLLRVAAENIKESEGGRGEDIGAMGRATESESLLNQNCRKTDVSDIPEKLVTQSMMMKQQQKQNDNDIPSIGSLFKTI